MKLKKVLVLLLALTMTLSLLAGCSKEPISGGDPQNSGSQSEPEVPKSYAPGVWDGDVYTSEFLQMKYTLPEGWTASTPEELIAQAESDGNPPTDKQREGDFSDAEAIYELSVTSDDGSALMSVMVMNLSLNPINKLINEKDMFEGMVDGLTEQFGEVDIVPGDVFDQVIGGKDFRVLPISFADGVMTQWNAICFDGDYLYMVTLVVIGDAMEPASVLTGFEALA